LPILYLIIKGTRPKCKINEKDLRKKLSAELPILDSKIYQKFNESIRTIDQYMIA
jgi:hypothetical protein